jgi:CRISPR-associated protein Cst2
LAKEQKLPLSKYAEALNPNRISGEELGSYTKTILRKRMVLLDVIDAMIDICTVCDTHGILITDRIGEIEIVLIHQENQQLNLKLDCRNP